MQLDFWTYLESVLKEEHKKRLVRHEWSQDEKKDLHLYLLEKSLKQLKSKKTAQRTKQEIIRWAQKPLANEPEAFSFQTCCLLAGVDPEKMQTEVLRISRNLYH